MCGYGSGNEKGIEGGGLVSKYYPGTDNSCYGSEAASYSSLGLAESYSSDGTYFGGICGTSVCGAAIGSASHGALYNAASRIVIDGGKKAIYAAALGGMLGGVLAKDLNATVISDFVLTSSLDLGSGTSAVNGTINSGGILRLSNFISVTSTYGCISYRYGSCYKSGYIYSSTYVVGAMASQITINSGGAVSGDYIYIYNSSSLSSIYPLKDVTINNGGIMYGGGSSITINNGGIMSGGGSSITINNGGIMSGSGTSITINNGGIMSGSGTSITINNGGIMSGSGTSITINNGGIMYGSGTSITINNGGIMYGSHLYGGTINSGGKIIFDSYVYLSGVVGNGGTVEIGVSGSSAYNKVYCYNCSNIQLKINTEAEPEDNVYLGYGTGLSLKGGSYDYGASRYVIEIRSDYEYAYDGHYNYRTDLVYLTQTYELSNMFYNAITAPAATVATVQTSLNSLQKRMGELRLLGNQSETGTWGRTYYKNLTIKGTDTDLSAYGAEAGYDWHYGGLPEWLGGDYSADISTGTASGGEGFYMGYMAGGTYLDVKGKSMEGSGLNALAGGYATYIAEDGTFLDATLRLGLNRVETKSYKPDGDVLSFTPNRIFVAVSLEGGRTYQIANTKWILEPKGELSVLAMPGTTADITGAEKGSIKFGMGTFINAKAALRAFYSYKNKRGFENVPYAEVAYSKDLKAESDVTYAGNTYPGAGKVEQFEGRLGINYQMSSNLYWNVAAEFESGDRTQGFGLDAGIRYMFGGKSKTENATTVALDDSAKEEENKNIIPAEIVMPENPELTAVEVVVPEETVAENIQSSPSSRRRRRSNAAAGNSESAQKTPNDKFSELNAEEYAKKAADAEKQYAESGTMAIPSAGLLFQIGKSEVLPYYNPMLDSFIKLYKQGGGNAKILIEAYSSNGGNETAKNPELSKQRAKSVYKYLVGNGIPKENITVRAYSNKKIGEGVFSEDPNCKAGQCYRRVDISIK